MQEQREKADSNEDVIMWLNLASDRMTVPELPDYARRYLVDRFSVLDGVARVRVSGGGFLQSAGAAYRLTLTALSQRLERQLSEQRDRAR